MNSSNENSREQNDLLNMIDNHIWEIAKLLNPHSYIEPEKIKQTRDVLIPILSK